MAEVSFFMMPEDVREFVQFLIDEFQARFVLDGADSPRIVQLDNAIRVASAIERNGIGERFFVISDQWSVLPLQFDEIHHTDGRHRWYVRQRYGGPAFDFKLSNILSGDGQVDLIPGWFSDYPWYYVRSNSTEAIERPDSMLDAFKRVRKHLRQQGKRTRCTEYDRPGPWVMKHALEGFDNGRHRLRVGDELFSPVD